MDQARRHFLKALGFVAAGTVASPWLRGAELLGVQGSPPAANRSKASRHTAASHESTETTHYDVIVAGGGPAGCAAAVAAARQGRKVLLIEATGMLGGMGTSGMVPSWSPFTDGEKVIYRGLAKEVFDMAREGIPYEPADKLDWVTINPEHLATVYDLLTRQAGVEVLLMTRLAHVEMGEKGHISAIVTANKAGTTRYRAEVYVDATGDGDLATWAGAEVMRQQELQRSTLCFSLGGVDTEAYLSGPELHSGHNPDSASVRAHHSGRYPLLDTHCCHNLVGKGVVQFNANHIDIADTTDPLQLSLALARGRQVAQQHAQMLREFRPDAFKDAFVVKTAVVPGVRDSRRIMGDYLFTVDDWKARRSFADEIGRNCYFIDIHKHGYPQIHYQRGESHGIPYRCLTPRGLTNVLVAGRCLSVDAEAFGSLRIMPCCLVTGQAAGTAAAMASVSPDHDVHNIDTQRLRSALRQAGAYFL